jgi:hypothetical protein
LWLGVGAGAKGLTDPVRECAALVARADQQHAWVLAGDERGIYGDYAPKQID